MIRLGIWVCASLLWCAALAHAQPGPPPVELKIDACIDVAWPRVRELVQIELGTVSVHDGAAGPPRAPRDTTQVVVGCVPQAVSLSIVDPVTGKRMQRTISMEGVPDRARPRLLALAITELVAASWLELDTVSRVPSAERTASPETQRGARWALHRMLDERARWRIAVAVNARHFARPATWFVGLSGVGRWSFRPHWAVHAELGVELAERSTRLGDARAQLVSGALGVSTQGRVGVFELHTGMGARAGVVDIAGRARQGGVVESSVFGGWGAPYARAGVGVVAWTGGRIDLAAETGWVVRSVIARANQDVALAVDGWFVTLQLGLVLLL